MFLQFMRLKKCPLSGGNFVAGILIFFSLLLLLHIAQEIAIRHQNLEQLHNSQFPYSLCLTPFFSRKMRAASTKKIEGLLGCWKRRDQSIESLHNKMAYTSINSKMSAIKLTFKINNNHCYALILFKNVHTLISTVPLPFNQLQTKEKMMMIKELATKCDTERENVKRKVCVSLALSFGLFWQFYVWNIYQHSLNAISSYFPSIYIGYYEVCVVARIAQEKPHNIHIAVVWSAKKERITCIFSALKPYGRVH